MDVRPSPFPGMDPYLEPQWESVHAQLVTGASRQLNRLVPRGLVARPERRSAVELEDVIGSGPTEVRGYRPDVRVSATPATPVGGAAAVLDAPFTLYADLDPVVQRHVRVTDARDGRLLTVIEFLSPTNKQGRGLRRYVDKRSDLIDAGVNVVEVDLVRQGDWAAVLDPHECPPAAVSTYRATVRLTDDPARVRLFPIGLRQSIPPVPIPLRSDDAPVPLEVQRLLDDTYADDQYGQTLNYTDDLAPPLPPDDAAWADALLRAAGRRP